MEFRVYYLKVKSVRLVRGKAVGVCSQNLLVSVGKVQLSVSSSDLFILARLVNKLPCPHCLFMHT